MQLDYPHKDGSRRANLVSVWKQTGVMPKTLQQKPLRDHERWLWDTFWELSAGRQSSFDGPMRIAYAEMAAFVQLTGVDLDGWEVEAIRRMDIAFVSEIRIVSKRNQ